MQTRDILSYIFYIFYIFYIVIRLDIVAKVSPA